MIANTYAATLLEGLGLQTHLLCEPIEHDYDRVERLIPVACESAPESITGGSGAAQSRNLYRLPRLVSTASTSQPRNHMDLDSAMRKDDICSHWTSVVRHIRLIRIP